MLHLLRWHLLCVGLTVLLVLNLGCHGDIRQVDVIGVAAVVFAFPEGLHGLKLDLLAVTCDACGTPRSIEPSYPPASAYDDCLLSPQPSTTGSTATMMLMTGALPKISRSRRSRVLVLVRLHALRSGRS